MCPPNYKGTVVKVYGGETDGKEEMTLEDTLLEVRDETTGVVTKLTMSHLWPVRSPRPVIEKLPGNHPLMVSVSLILCSLLCWEVLVVFLVPSVVVRL